MMDFAIHPQIYATGAHNGLSPMLENIWIHNHRPGVGTFYIISGFANFNGGARFYRTFSEHIEHGGRVIAFFSGSTAQRLSSKQVVEAMLECGAEVHIINRKRLLHAKCYGVMTDNDQKLVVSSGNFTGPGMAQNIEASILLGTNETQAANFSWPQLESSLINQRWQRYIPNLATRNTPAWDLLYDELGPGEQSLIDESDKVTLIMTLGHADTARIQAARGTSASLGSQYFWLSKDCFGFFPPLTIRNTRGIKGTLSTAINLRDVRNNTSHEVRVTFEAENNLDFRLGTGFLRYSCIAGERDLACISRINDDLYELRVIEHGTAEYNRLIPYAINFIGHRGKQYGFIDNDEFESVLGIQLGPTTP